jgi:hypothetical protein
MGSKNYFPGSRDFPGNKISITAFPENKKFPGNGKAYIQYDLGLCSKVYIRRCIII